MCIFLLVYRKPDGITLPKDFHLTPIPTDEQLSSISAMLLHDEYYEFTLENCAVYEGLWLPAEGRSHQIQSNDIEKHKKDVLKLAATLASTDQVDCPDIIKEGYFHLYSATGSRRL